MNSANDPFPGWLDNIYGPIGLLLAGGKGVLRVVYHNKHTTLDMIPVDFVIKTAVAIPWKLGLTKYDQHIHTYKIHFHRY
jgi:fatty acyl-CoA reductase